MYCVRKMNETLQITNDSLPKRLLKMIKSIRYIRSDINAIPYKKKKKILLKKSKNLDWFKREDTNKFQKDVIKLKQLTRIIWRKRS